MQRTQSLLLLSLFMFASCVSSSEQETSNAQETANVQEAADECARPTVEKVEKPNTVWEPLAR